MRGEVHSQGFCRSIDTIMRNSDIQNFSTELLSRIAPNVNSFQNRLSIRTRDEQDLVGLAVLSWYLPRELGCLLRLELSELTLQNYPDFSEIFLENKGLMLCYLIETKRWHTRDFFGNICSEKIVNHLLKLVRPVFGSKRRPKRKIRHRGYRDKGSLRKEHEYHDFSEGTREQRTLESERSALKDAIQLKVGWFT